MRLAAYDAYVSAKAGGQVHARTFDHASNPFTIPSPGFTSASAVPSLDQPNSSPTGCEQCSHRKQRPRRCRPFSLSQPADTASSATSSNILAGLPPSPASASSARASRDPCRWPTVLTPSRPTASAPDARRETASPGGEGRRGGFRKTLILLRGPMVRIPFPPAGSPLRTEASPLGRDRGFEFPFPPAGSPVRTHGDACGRLSAAVPFTTGPRFRFSFAPAESCCRRGSVVNSTARFAYRREPLSTRTIDPVVCVRCVTQAIIALATSSASTHRRAREMPDQTARHGSPTGCPGFGEAKLTPKVTV